MERLDEIEKVFEDLRNRVSALPRLRHKAMQEELSDLILIINNIEKAIVSHVAADEDEEGIQGLIGKTIETFPLADNAENQVKSIQYRLKTKYAIEISTKALKRRIKKYLGQ